MSEGDGARIENFHGNAFSADCLFSASSPNVVKNLSQIKQEKIFPEKVPVCAAGDVPKGVYILLRGKAQFSRNESGKKSVVRLLEPNEIIGLTETLAEVPCEINAETVTPCVFEFIEGKDLLKFLREDPEVCFRLARILADNLQKSYRNFAGL